MQNLAGFGWLLPRFSPLIWRKKSLRTLKKGGYDMKTFQCTRLRLCNYLMDRGFFPYRVEPDPSNPRFQEITNRIPAHRWGTPDDMKGTVIFLASHASDYLNGAVIPVDGGYLVK